MVTIIHLSAAPNPLVGPLTVVEPCNEWMMVTIVHLSEANPGVGHSCSCCCSCLVLASIYDVVRHRPLADLSTNYNAVLICFILMRGGGGGVQISVSRRVPYKDLRYEDR